MTLTANEVAEWLMGKCETDTGPMDRFVDEVQWPDGEDLPADNFAVVIEGDVFIVSIVEF